MKLSIAIAGKKALPSAFVVFRGFEDSIRKSSELGFEGVELALRSGSEVKGKRLSEWLSKYNMEVSAISTGQVFAERGLSLTDEDKDRRNQVIKDLQKMVDMAADFGKKVNVGRIRGKIGDRKRSKVNSLFKISLESICNYADKKNVTILLEPVNRYEIDYINSVAEAGLMLNEFKISNLKIMPDLFHMNIEDVNIEDEIRKNIENIGYIHFADSNRLAPGYGHLSFHNVIKTLREVGYSDWIALEILPKPDPNKAAYDGFQYLKNLLRK